MSADQLAQAIALIKAQRPTEALPLLKAVLRADHTNIAAWMWYVEAQPTIETRIAALEHCLKYNPGNEKAQGALTMLQARRTAVAPPSPPASVPAARQTVIPAPPAVRPARRASNNNTALLLALGGGGGLVGLAGIALAAVFLLRGNPLAMPPAATPAVNAASVPAATSTSAMPTLPPTQAQPTQPPPAFTGAWRQAFDTSSFDDSRSVYLSLVADNSIEGWLTTATPKLIVRCQERELDVYIITGVTADIESGLDDAATFRIRFDKEEATEIVLGESTDGEAYFFYDGAETIDSVLRHETLVAGFTPFNGSPQTMTFDVRGLAGVIGPLWDECGQPGGVSSASAPAPIASGPTATPRPRPTATRIPTLVPTATAFPVGSAIVFERDNEKWHIEVERIEIVQRIASDFSSGVEKAAGRFAVLIVRATNLGTSSEYFIPTGLMDIVDASGTRTEENGMASLYAHDTYVPRSYGEVSPDATTRAVIVYDVSTSSAYYRLVSGSLAQWSDASLLLDMPR